MELERLLKIPKGRLIKKLLGFDEIYTVAIRKKGENIFHKIPYSSKYWYADPLVYRYKNTDYLFVEAYNRKTGKGHIAVAIMNEDPEKIKFKEIIKEKYHMSFPMVFDWNQEIYMIPETSENFSINLYRAVDFPFKWKCVKIFMIKAKIVDIVLLKKESQKLYMLASEINSCTPLKVRYQKFSLQYNNSEWLLVWDDTFNIQQTYNLSDRNAGNTFTEGNQMILPTQESTDIDYGVRLVFREWNNNKWTVKRQMNPRNVVIKGIRNKSIIGIHTYSSTQQLEIIDVRYQKFSPVMQWKKIWMRLKND